MRVAFVTAGDPARLTGGYLYHARVFALLRQQGVRIDQYVVSRDPSLPGQLAATIDERMSDAVARADVVVIDALAAVACRDAIDGWREARPLVAMVHELPSVAGNIDSPVQREAEDRLLAADVVIAVSRHGAGILADRGVEPARSRIASPGADRIAATRRHRGSGQPLRVLSVAQWIPRKGIDTLVAAWDRLRPEDAILHLYGETDADLVYSDGVRRQIASARAEIVVHGAVDDATLAAAYASADLFALPSRYEGYGMVFAEALLHGLPIVACATGPVPDLVGSAAGVLVPAVDVAALASAIDGLLADPARRERMAAAAIERGRQLPTWSDAATGFLAALQDAVSLRSC